MLKSNLPGAGLSILLNFGVDRTATRCSQWNFVGAPTMCFAQNLILTLAEDPRLCERRCKLTAAEIPTHTPLGWALHSSSTTRQLALNTPHDDALHIRRQVHAEALR